MTENSTQRSGTARWLSWQKGSELDFEPRPSYFPAMDFGPQSHISRASAYGWLIQPFLTHWQRLLGIITPSSLEHVALASNSPLPAFPTSFLVSFCGFRDLIQATALLANIPKCLSSVLTSPLNSRLEYQKLSTGELPLGSLLGISQQHHSTYPSKACSCRAPSS